MTEAVAAGLLVCLVALMCLPVYYYFKNRKLESAFNKLSDTDRESYLARIDLLAEDKVRKKWLIAMLLNMSLSALMFSLILVGLVLTNAVPLSFLFISLSFALVIIGINIAVAYYCAYKKRGTIHLVLSLMSIGSGVLSLLTGSDTDLDYSDPLLMALLLILILPQLYYFWHSLKLYRVNAFRRSLKRLAVNEQSLST